MGRKEAVSPEQKRDGETEGAGEKWRKKGNGTERKRETKRRIGLSLVQLSLISSVPLISLTQAGQGYPTSLPHTEREKQIIGRESDGGNVIERWDVAHINE